MRDELKRAKELADTQPDEALRLCNEVLNESFDNKDGQIALFMSGYLMMQAKRYGLAYHIFQRCAQLRPEQSEIYSNMGMCLEEHDKYKSIEMFDKSYKLDPTNTSAIANKALMYLQTGRPKQCLNLCNEALRLKPDLRAATHNKSLAKLMLRDWSGWKEYNDTLGVKHREKRCYGLPEWNGEDGEVLVYAEQGVGDEIMFASCLPDLVNRGNSVIFDCDSRLESIFKRSFNFPVYGTRFKKETPILDNHNPDYQVAIGQLPYFFRKKDEDYPGTPYMKPDPERVIQWGALLDKQKLNVGVAWRGGLISTGESVRSASPKIFDPLLEMDGVQLINLDYKPIENEEIPGIINWPRACLKGCDLEETFALIANLDAVVTVCTAVVYMAGSQGTPCHVLVPDHPGYRYHIKGDTWPWYNSVKLHRGKFHKSMRAISENIYRLRSDRDSSVPRSMPFDTVKSVRAG